MDKEKLKVLANKLMFTMNDSEYETLSDEFETIIKQMELIGHDFFLFKNDKTNELCVVYKREDGGYGILEAKAK